MKILIVGFGSIGQRHFKNLKKLGFSPEIYSRHLHKTKLSENSYYDLILICSKTSDHLKDIKKFKNLSSNFFIEKPLAMSLFQAKEIKKMLKNKKVVIGYILTFHPLIKKVKDFIKKQKLGHIYLVQIHSGSYLPDWRSNRDYRLSYSSKKNEGGGVLLDIIHEINYFRFIFPEKIISISNHHNKISNLEITSDDIAILCIHQKSHYTSIILNYFQKLPERYIKIYGENKTLLCDLEKSNLDIFNHKNKKISNQKIKLNFNDLYIKEIELVINCIKKKTLPPKILSLNQGIEDLNIIENA